MAENIAGVIEEGSNSEVLEKDRTTDGIEMKISTEMRYGEFIQVLGGSYSGTIDSFDTNAPMIAEVYVAPEDQTYLIEIQPEWGRRFSQGQMSETEYLARIREGTTRVSS